MTPPAARAAPEAGPPTERPYWAAADQSMKTLTALTA
jgi:hypothetical protein